VLRPQRRGMVFNTRCRPFAMREKICREGLPGWRQTGSISSWAGHEPTDNELSILFH